MKINLKKIIIAVALLLVLILLASGVVYFYLVKNFPAKEQPEKLSQYCLADDEIVEYNENTEISVVISVKDKKTEREKFSFQIDGVDTKHYHPTELHRCWIYVMRTFNYDPKKSKQDSGYREELWKYDYNGNGEMIILLAEKPKEFISYYSYDFRVDSTEKYIVLIGSYLGKDDYAIIIKNLETKEDIFVLSFKEIINEYPDLAGSFGFKEWTKNGRYFWADIFVGANALGFLRIDTLNWKADIFPAPENTMGGDALNMDTGYITIHSDYTYFGIYELEQAEKEKRRQEGIGSEIYIENLIIQKRYFVNKTDEPLWFFKPKWISETELEYYLPSGEKKVYKIIDP